MRRYTVSAISAELGKLVHRHYPSILVEGEIGQLQTPASGHAYFTLRDSDAVLNAVCWRSEWRAQRYRPEPGARVLCRGRLGLFTAQSRYQLYVHQIEPAGQGALARELAARRARLDAEGLLDPRRKRALPRAPRVVGLATSPTGAALQDFLEVSRARFPAARILVAPCVVQGPEAPSSVILALELLVDDGRAEVLVVTRGGGAKADLLAFHDEQLARWIAHSPVPVVSAVGHQIDTTLCDLVADAVAPTPSAAAVTVLPDGAGWAQRVDEAALQLQASMGRVLSSHRRRLGELRRRLRGPADRLAAARARRAELLERLDAAMARWLASRTTAVVSTRARLDAVGPERVLARGYALVTGADGVVTDAARLREGDAVRVRVARGSFGATVTTD